MQIDYLEPADGAYRAGVCNLNTREIAKRRTFGIAAIAAAIAFGAFLVVIDAPPPLRVLVVLPLVAGLISFEEARRRFCGAFAFFGIRSAAGSDATERVTDPGDLSADRAAARWLVAYCGAIAVVVTVAFILAPI